MRERERDVEFRVSQAALDQAMFKYQPRYDGESGR